MKEFVNKHGLKIALVFLLLSLGLLSYQYCLSVKQFNNEKKDYQKIIDGSAAAFKIEKTKLGETIAKQEQLILTTEQALNTVISEKELKDLQIKKLQAQLKAITTTAVTNLPVPFDSSTVVVINKPEDVVSGVKYLKVPAPFKKENEWLKIQGNVEETGLKFDTIAFINKPSFTIGVVHEKGIRRLFKRPKKSIIFKDENPYVSITGMSNVIIEEKPKWYQTKLFWFGTGATISALAIYGISTTAK